MNAPMQQPNQYVQQPTEGLSPQMMAHAAAAPVAGAHAGMSRAAIAAIAAACVAALAAVAMGFMALSGGFGGSVGSVPQAQDHAATPLSALPQVQGASGQGGAQPSAAPAPVTVTQVQQPAVVTVQAQQPVAQPNSGTGSYGGYSHYRAMNRWTSEAFAANVYSAFMREYSATGSRTTTLRVYSPATGGTYVMSCAGSVASVTCSGGDKAVVNIY